MHRRIKAIHVSDDIKLLMSTLYNAYYLTLKSIILNLDEVYRLFRWLVSVEDGRLFISFSLFLGCLRVAHSVVQGACWCYDSWVEDPFKHDLLLLILYSP